MKYILIIVLSILTFSQSKKDSLLNLANNSNSDSVRITAYKDLADLSFGDPNLVPEYLNKALEIAKNNSFYEKIALLYNEKAVQKISISEFDSAEYYYRRSLEFSVDHKLGMTGFKTYQGLSAVARKRNDPMLEKELLFKAGEFAKNNNYLTGVGESYRFLASFYARNGNSDSARFYLDKGVDFFTTNNDLEKEAELLNQIAIFFARNAKYDSSEYYFKKTETIRKEIVEKAGTQGLNKTKESYQNSLADTYKNLGFVNYLQAKYDKCIEYSFLAMEYYEKLNNQRKVATMLSDIANIQIDNLNLPINAIENLKKAIEINIDQKNVANLTRNYFTLGNAYRNIDSFELAIRNYNLAEESALNSGDYKSLALVYMNEGQVYFKQKDLKKSEDRYLKAIEINETKNKEEKERLANSYVNIADLYKEMGQNSKALRYLNKAKVIVEKFTNPESLLGVYDNLAQVYDSLGVWQLAYQNHKNYSDLKDSIRKASIEKTIADMTAKYESEKKEQQIKSLEEQKLLDESRRRNLNIAFGIGIVSLIIFILVMYNRYRLKNKSNLQLERQKNLIEKQKLIVDEKNEEILSSMRYAEGIQEAMMPVHKEMDEALDNYFLMFKPKDIVSGDFYWFAETGGTVFIAAVDCTGHGIPGAMLSLVGSMILNEAVKVNGVYDPDLILEYLNQKVTTFLRQDQEDIHSQDGMDICLVKIPRERDKVLFSGAKRPLFVTRPNGDIESIRGDLKSIGGRQRKKDVDFTTKEIPIEKDMGIYLLSDGFIDQIGVDGKKYGTKNFKNFLSKNYKYTMKEQERLLDFEFKNHIGKQEQRDDITVIGIKL